MSRTTLDELVLMVVRDKATKKRSASSSRKSNEDGSGKRKRARVVPSVPDREQVSTPPVRRPKAQVTTVRKEKKRARRAGSSKRSYSRRCSDLPGAVRLWESPLNEELLMKWNQALDRYSEICTKFCEKQRDNAVRGDIESHKEYLTRRGKECIKKEAHERYQNLITRIEVQTSPQLDKHDLSVVRNWKMTRCIWRPTWYESDENKDEKTKQVTKSAFEKINRLKLSRDKDTILRDAIDKLRDLMGVGPAFSCGILALKSRDVAFFSPESIQCCGATLPHKAFNKKRVHSVEAAIILNRILRERAEKLTEYSKSSMRDVRRYWGARDVEYALFSASHGGLRGDGA